MNRLLLAHAALFVTLTHAGTAAAQSAQTLSAQASFLATSIRFNGVTANGTGVELQFRFNHVKVSDAGALSIGVGAQRTQHAFPGSTFTIAGAFLEPRFAFSVSSNRFFPYVAARFALLQQSNEILAKSTGSAIGAGAGFAYAINTRLNLDIGAALVTQKFADTHLTGSTEPYAFNRFLGYAAKAGLSFGL